MFLQQLFDAWRECLVQIVAHDVGNLVAFTSFAKEVGVDQYRDQYTAHHVLVHDPGSCCAALFRSVFIIW